MKKKGYGKKYVIWSVILICLILTAFFAPQVMMGIQDYQLSRDYNFQERRGIEYDAFNTDYTMDRTERLNDYARGLKEGKHYVLVSTESGMKNWKETAEGLLGQDMVYLLKEMGAIPAGEELLSESNVKDYDHYIICDKNGETHPIVCGYVQLETNECVIRFLFDSVDYTIYYVEIYHDMIYDHFIQGLAKGKMEWDFILYDLVSFIYYYGVNIYDEIKIDYGKKTENESKEAVQKGIGEVIREIPFDEGEMHVTAGFLKRWSDYSWYGFGVGIKELRDLLPDGKIGKLWENE